MAAGRQVRLVAGALDVRVAFRPPALFRGVAQMDPLRRDLLGLPSDRVFPRGACGGPPRARDRVRERDRPRQLSGGVIGLARFGEPVDGEGDAQGAGHVVELARALPAVGLVQPLAVLAEGPS